MRAFPLIAVDIGNARIKVGFFDVSDGGELSAALPRPRDVLRLNGRSPELRRLAEWIKAIKPGDSPTTFADGTSLGWWIASVNRPAATALIDWLRENRPADSLTLLSAVDLPLAVALDAPDQVGIDRLVDAVAANRMRCPQRPAVVVDVGTAITVDLLSAQGVFKGGAILPGLEMAARAMHEFTDLLPLMEMSDLDSPPSAVGVSTGQAINSGLFWGAVGAIRQLVERMTDDAQQLPQVIITGGAGERVARLLDAEAVYVPQLTLSGIALSAWSGTDGLLAND